MRVHEWSGLFQCRVETKLSCNIPIHDLPLGAENEAGTQASSQRRGFIISEKGDGGAAHWYPLIPHHPPPSSPWVPATRPQQILIHSHPSANLPHPTLTLSQSPSPIPAKPALPHTHHHHHSIRRGTLYTLHTHCLPLDVIHGSVTVQLEVTDIE